jgi:hypothetical protein
MSDRQRHKNKPMALKPKSDRYAFVIIEPDGSEVTLKEFDSMRQLVDFHATLAPTARRALVVRWLPLGARVDMWA